jgi:8-oxo-dGTP diphosphatase
MDPAELAVRVLLAQQAGKSLEEAGVPLNSRSKKAWADIKASLAAMPAGAQVEVPHGILPWVTSGIVQKRARVTYCRQGHKHRGPGAAGILIRAPRPDGTMAYLLQRRMKKADEPLTWGTFGGTLHQGEAVRDGAKREVEEETGVKPDAYEIGHKHTDDHGGWAYTTYIADAPETFWPSFDGSTPEESAGWGWFTPDQMKDLDLHPAFKKQLSSLIRAEKREMVSKASVHYREGTDDRRCGNCVMFHYGRLNSTCDLVTGSIDSEDVCDRWEAKPAEKARRTVGLNGQETWEDGDNGPPYPAAGGGSMMMPPVPGGVPGSTAGGEPPRWDGSQPEPRTEFAPDDADDAKWPTEGRVASQPPKGPFPATYMDGYWPLGGQGTSQAGASSPGGARGMPPSTVRVKKRVSIPDLVKVGPEGYIHGFICVRPPCGPRYAEMDHDTKTGKVHGGGRLVGRQLKKEAGDHGYSIAHITEDGKKVKLGGQYATRHEAAKAIAAYHNITVMHDAADDSPAKDHLSKAHEAMLAGDHEGAVAHLSDAHYAAITAGNENLAHHIGSTRDALGEQALPVPKPGEPKKPEAPAVDHYQAFYDSLPGYSDSNPVRKHAFIAAEENATDDHEPHTPAWYSSFAHSYDLALDAARSDQEENDRLDYPHAMEDPHDDLLNGFTTSWESHHVDDNADVVTDKWNIKRPDGSTAGTLTRVRDPRKNYPDGVKVTDQNGNEVASPRAAADAMAEEAYGGGLAAPGEPKLSEPLRDAGKPGQVIIPEEPREAAAPPLGGTTSSDVVSHIPQVAELPKPAEKPAAGGLPAVASASVTPESSLTNSNVTRLSSPLSPDEESAVHDYAGTRYSQVNDFLRSGKEHSMADERVRTAEMISNLDSAIGKSRLSKPVTLHRSVNEHIDWDASEAAGKQVKWPPDGISEWHDPAFMSTSENLNGMTTAAGTARLDIHLPAGHPALAVRTAGLGTTEKEVLLPRGQHFRVTGMHRDEKTGQRVFDLEPSNAKLEAPEPAVKVPAADANLSPNEKPLAGWEVYRTELTELAKSGDDKRDRALERITQLNGFDAKPEKAPLDPSRESLYRGFGDRYDQSNGPELAQRYTDGDYFGSTGIHGNGAYFTTRKDRAEGYGHVLEAQLKPDAKVISQDDAWKLADEAPDEWKPVIGSDPGKAAALHGYDAIKTKGSALIVLNRGALRVAPNAQSVNSKITE